MVNSKEDEIAQIKMRYDRRNNYIYNSDKYFYSGLYAKNERDMIFAQIIRDVFGNDLSSRKVIEIGAGSGHNLLFFQYLGFQWGNIYANELLEDRFSFLKNRILSSPVQTTSSEWSKEVCFQGDALDLPFKGEFDVVLQSTVFSSILDMSFREKLAEKMFDMLKPGGIVLSYDFTYNNPQNKDVLKLTKADIKSLYPNAREIYFRKVTLAPPIARRLGSFYNIINFLFPFLRTHMVTCIKK